MRLVKVDGRAKSAPVLANDDGMAAWAGGTRGTEDVDSMWNENGNGFGKNRTSDGDRGCKGVHGMDCPGRTKAET